jgi:DNA-binding MarR family transcriptional regulator
LQVKSLSGGLPRAVPVSVRHSMLEPAATGCITARLFHATIAAMSTSRAAADRGRGAAALSSELPSVLQFMQLLWAIVHGVERRSKRMTLDLGVTGPQRLVLRVAGLFPGVSAGELASILHVHPSTLTGILQRLIDVGLLVRTSDVRDRRRARLRLTARGARVNAMTRGTVEAAIAATLRRSSAAERSAAERLLERLAEQLAAPEETAVRRRQRA